MHLVRSLPPPASDGTVADFQADRSKRRCPRKTQVEPTPAQITRICDDIWKGKDARQASKPVKGVSRRRPPLTFEGEQAIREASKGFWQIANAIDDLKEPSLKGFIFEAERRSKVDELGFLYRAVAEMAKERLGILQERRSQKGNWYAVVEVLRWRDHVGELLEEFHVKCDGKLVAVAAGRRLLAENADKFSDDITVEARLLTETEWKRRSRTTDD